MVIERIRSFWQRSLLGKAVIAGVGLFVMCCACTLMLAVVGQAGQAVGIIPTLVPTPPPTSTPTAGPIDMPGPTETPVPTVPPTEAAEPTVLPTETPVPATATPIPPIVLSGNGARVTDPLELPYTAGYIAASHQGRRNFIVTVYTGNNDQGDILINAIGAYSGTRFLSGDSPVFFEVQADGAWKLTISPLASDSEAAQGVSGSGDWVSGVFKAPPRTVYHFTHTGKRNFIVYLRCDDGGGIVQNEIGAVESEAVVRFPGKACLWEVQADGEWAIAPK